MRSSSTKRSVSLLVSLGSVSLLSASCGAGTDSDGHREEDADGSAYWAPLDFLGDGDGDGEGEGDIELPGCDEPGCENESCGDGILGEFEVCDDGNTSGGDGCVADCSNVEPGYTCPTVGVLCTRFARCGDGVVSFPEQCDDENLIAGDGCSDRCKLEIGFKCEGSPSSCSHTTCGDGIREGAEACDDGNAFPFDGCNSLCQVEPYCGPLQDPDGCSSTCGDGLKLGEECDDGNLIDGDGCSKACTLEPGSTCTISACEEVGGECVVLLPVIYRDFDASHSNMEVGGGCSNGGAPYTNVVQSALDARGRPKIRKGLDNVGAACADRLELDWYKDTALSNTILSEMVLYRTPTGAFVNRFGAGGEQWVAPGGALLDGNPLFFPLDHHPEARTPTAQYQLASVAAPYAGDSGAPESDFFSPAPTHNFHFTTEIQYWFEFDASKTATLDFTGDDDVFVFVNGALALEMAGVHPPATGAVEISAATAPNYSLKNGNVYPITIFHAERQTTGSSFRLTLENLTLGRSTCGAECGDKIIGPGEECDDGENAGGYNRCQEDCRLGGYCGDGIVQDEEDCDFRVPGQGTSCTTNCRKAVVR